MLQRRERHRRRIARTRAPGDVWVPERYRAICPILIYASSAAVVLTGAVVLVALAVLVALSLSSATKGPTMTDAKVDAPPEITPAKIRALQQHVPGTIRSVSVVRLPDDKFFCEALANAALAPDAEPGWCKGLAADPALIFAAGSVVALAQVPVIQPVIYVIEPVLHDAGGRLTMADADRERLVKAGVSRRRVHEVARAFEARKEIDRRIASVIVQLPAIDALPVADLPEGRTVLAALVIPADQYRDDVMLQCMPAFVDSMLRQLGTGASARPRKTAYVSYWWQPWSIEAANVKIFAVRYATAADVGARKLVIQRIAQLARAPAEPRNLEPTEATDAPDAPEAPSS
jgi:hypothetical protein